MSVEQKLESDIKDAMRAKSAEKLQTLRMVKAAIDNEKIAKKTETLSDDQIITIIQKQVKQRKESIESFDNAGRKELADKERSEITHLEPYLPAQLSEEEILSLVKETIQEVGASQKADAGNVMKALMPKVKGKADGKQVNKLLMGLLS